LRSALASIAALVAALAPLGCGGSSPRTPAAQPAAPAAAPAPAPAAPPARLRKQWTEHLGRLTNTPVNDCAALAIRGTDLGASFARDGKIAFLFGDSWTTDGANWDDDSAATTPLAPLAPGALPRLSWLRDPASPARFLPIRVPGVRLGGMCVPVEGVPVGPLTYIFCSAGWDPAAGRHRTSVLAHASGLDLDALVLDHAVASDRFLNVSVVVDGTIAWIFGTGPYRASPVYLAGADVATLALRASWRYFAGLAGGAPQWAASEQAAVALSPSADVGEISVRRHPTLGLYLMAYNSGSPRGIHLRTAPAPWGPWSDPPEVIFAPGIAEDGGYEHFMHADERVALHDDGLSEPGREQEWGGEYGPYLVPEWFEDGPVPGSWTIVYTLSSWNPYAVHLMRTMLAAPGVAVPPPARGAGLARARIADADFSIDPYDPASGWRSTGDRFARFYGAFGTPEWRLTTYGAAGDATRGTLFQDFAVDAGTSELRFRVHGGHAAVKLLRLSQGGEVVRASRGRNDNARETPVVWQLADFRGETVRLVIEDDLSEPWGFVSVSGFELR
jgi:hypothetical protein